MAAARARTGRSTERGSATRERVLEAAAEVLAERGYAGTSISAVCERADVAPTSIYWHFGNKAGLFEELLRSHGAQHFEGIRAAAAAGGEPLERLDRALAAMRELAMQRPPGSLSALSLLAEGRHATPDLRQALQRRRLEEIEQTAADLAAVTGRPHPDLDAAALVMTACANYAALTHRIEGDPREVDRTLEALRRAILALVGPHLADGADAGDETGT